MALIRPRPYWDWTGMLIEVALKASLLGILGGLSIWLWPDGLFDAPLASVRFTEWLWALAAAWAGLLFLLALYFAVLLPVLCLFISEDAKD
jgi:hypothetical protein